MSLVDANNMVVLFSFLTVFFFCGDWCGVTRSIFIKPNKLFTSFVADLETGNPIGHSLPHSTTSNESPVEGQTWFQLVGPIPSLLENASTIPLAANKSSRRHPVPVAWCDPADATSWR